MLNPQAGVRPIATRSRRCRLRARGDFDRDNCVLLIEAVLAALPDKPATITIDARDVTFADAAVVSALLYCRDLAAQSQCTLRIVHATGVFAHVLRVTGVWPELCLLTRVV
jgi:anti-anti-sigma regulatory factor